MTSSRFRVYPDGLPPEVVSAATPVAAAELVRQQHRDRGGPTPWVRKVKRVPENETEEA